MSKWRVVALPLALLLPVVLLAGQWMQARSDASKGVIWYIPVTGYDPHDMLRGHYVMLRYQWPKLREDAYPIGPCIHGRAPNIESVNDIEYVDGEPMTQGCDAFVRAGGGYNFIDPSQGTRLYANREEAQRIEKALVNGQQGLLTARIRPDGVIVPISVTMSPKSTLPPASNTPMP